MERELKYQQIKSFLLEELSSGRWAVGDRFYTDVEMAARFGTTPVTVRKAFAALEASGHITRRRGSGTYVASLPARPQRVAIVQRCIVGLAFAPAPSPFNFVLMRSLYELTMAVEAAGYIAMPVFCDYKSLTEVGASGVIIAEPLAPRRIAALKALHLPLVAYGSLIAPDTPSVVADPADCARQLVKCLAQNGHKSLLLSGYAPSGLHIQRTVAPQLERLCADAGIAFRSVITDHGVGTHALLPKVLDEEHFDAVCLANVFCRKPLEDALQERELRIGRDISVISLGSSALVQPTTPPYSFLDWDMAHAARLSVKLLQEVIRDPQAPHPDVPCRYNPVIDRGSIRHA